MQRIKQFECNTGKGCSVKSQSYRMLAAACTGTCINTEHSVYRYFREKKI